MAVRTPCRASNTPSVLATGPPPRMATVLILRFTVRWLDSVVCYLTPKTRKLAHVDCSNQNLAATQFAFGARASARFSASIPARLKRHKCRAPEIRASGRAWHQSLFAPQIITKAQQWPGHTG